MEFGKVIKYVYVKARRENIKYISAFLFQSIELALSFSMASCSLGGTIDDRARMPRLAHQDHVGHIAGPEREGVSYNASYRAWDTSFLNADMQNKTVGNYLVGAFTAR